MSFALSKDAFSTSKVNNKVLSIDEVNALIPQMEETINRLVQMNAQVNRIIDKLRDADVILNDNLTINPISGQDEDTINDLSSLKVLLLTIQDEVSVVHAHGGSIDNIEEAVICWQSKIDEHELTLSWKLGEKEVVFGVDNNNRKPLADILNP